MDEKRRFILRDDLVRRRACDHILQAPADYVVTVTPPIKTRPQEERYHAMIGDIAKQFKFLGRLWDPESMKRMLVAQFRAETKDDETLKPVWDEMGTMEFVPTLDMTGVVMLGWQTRRFPKKLAIAFIDWLYCFGAENNIRWSEKYREAAA
jgi:hypothetical protein